MQVPCHTIAQNAGVEGAVVVGKLLEQDNPDLGYDAAKGKPEDVYSGQSPVPLESCCARPFEPGRSCVTLCSLYRKDRGKALDAPFLFGRQPLNPQQCSCQDMSKYREKSLCSD
jgi:hypothetical protein